MKLLKVIVLALIITVLIYIINASLRKDSQDESSDKYQDTQKTIIPIYTPSDIDVNAEEKKKDNTNLPDTSGSLPLDPENLKQYLISNNVKSFEKLDLGNFNLNGSDIKYLVSLKELEGLSLSENNLFENEKNLNPEDLGALFQKLKLLKISNSKLNYENLDFICKNANNLEHLDISHNPNVLDKFNNLDLVQLLRDNSFLKLAENFLPPEIDYFSNLSDIPQQFYTDEDSPMTEISEKIGPIVLPKNLKSLQIAHSNVNVFQLKNLNIPKSLEKIDLSSNTDFQDIYFDCSISFDFHQFHSIDLSNCRISNLSFVQYLFKSEILKKLFLSSNPLSIDFKNLDPSKSIQILDFSNCKNLLLYKDTSLQIDTDTLRNQNSSNFIDFISNFQNLKDLNVKGVDITLSLIEGFKKIKNLNLIQ